MAQPVGKQLAEHGTQIFVYNNIRTNQVIYSLTRALHNHSSLKQLPFLGKKTVPARLRKDLWHPLCHISFPRPSQGLLAYRRLRELRRLHETNYPIHIITHNKRLLPTKKRGRVLMDQKANSVADLAKVLFLQKRGPKVAQIKNAERRKVRVERLKEMGKKSMRRRQPQDPEQPGVDGVVIRWANQLDAEFAPHWPEQVVHDGLAAHRYTAAFPETERPQEEIVQVAEGPVRTEGEDKKTEIPRALPEEKPKSWFSGFRREKTEGGKEKTEIPAALLEEKPKSWFSRLRGS